MQKTSLRPIDHNVYVGAWNVAKASFDPFGQLAETVNKIQLDGESKLNAMVFTEAFGLTVEIDERDLEHGSTVRWGFADEHGTAKTSEPELIGASLASATEALTEKVQRLATSLSRPNNEYTNIKLIPYRDAVKRKNPDSTLEQWQYMAAISNEDIHLGTGRLASRDNIELSFQFAGEEDPTIIDAVHFDDRSPKARIAMSTDFAAKQAGSWGRRILLGDLNAIDKHRMSGRTVARMGRTLGLTIHTVSLADRLAAMANDRTTLDRLREQGMEDVLGGAATMKLCPLPLIDLDHAYLNPDVYYATEWGTFSSPASDHKAITVSIVPGNGHGKWNENWRDSNQGKNSTWSYAPQASGDLR